MNLGRYLGVVIWLVPVLTDACTFKELVFRGASHTINGSGGIINLWGDSSTFNEDNAAARIIGYGGHYKSNKVNTWDTSTFNKVRLEVIKSGSEQIFFEFNATGTTKYTWFRRNKLIETSVNVVYQLHMSMYYAISYRYNSMYIYDYRYDCDYRQIVFVDVASDCYGCRCYSNNSPYPRIRFGYDGTSSAVTDADEIAIYFIKDGFDDAVPVPNLPWRNPSWDIPSVDDNNLPGGLYVTEGVYDMADFVVAGREIGCGAQIQIWLNDTLPENDGVYHEKRVCVTDRYNTDICRYNFTIDIMNCGDRRAYRLPGLTRDQYDIGTQSVAYCFDGARIGDPCLSTTPSLISNMENNRPTNIQASPGSDHWTEDWYSSGQYQLLRWSPELDQPRCGAESQIWMNGTFPIDDGMHHVRQLCITNRTTGDTCSVSTMFTYVKNCTTHIMYFLKPPPENSAYCFDIPSDSNEPPPSYLPSTVRIRFELHWIVQPNGGGTEKPSLRFFCDFDKDETNQLYYVIYFHVDDNYINLESDLVVQDVEEAYVTEETLYTMFGLTAGITISCNVGVRSSRNGRTGTLVKSGGFFAGLKMGHSVSVERGTGGSVQFQQTVPFGCAYHPSLEGSLQSRRCVLTVFLFKTSAENKCTSNTILNLNKCARELQGVTKETNINSETWEQRMHDFDIVTADNKRGTYSLLNSQFIFKLQVQNSLHHRFWENTTSDEVFVNVFDKGDQRFWQGKRCQVYCDPHMTSFDGMPYELQYPGKFMLLKYEDLPIQVQVQISACYGNNRTPYCACGLLVAAGKDVFQIYLCNRHRDITYKSCKDGVLKVDRKSSTVYKIYLPTGATIRVSVRKRYGLLDIDITPTIHEYKGRISGLCGDLDGNKENDCVSKGGSMPCREPYPGGYSYRYHPNAFTRSYRLSEEENLLNVDPNIDLLESYPTSSQMCVCPQNNAEVGKFSSFDSFVRSSVHCSSTQYVNCSDTRQEVKCTVTDRRIIRKKRSVDSSENVQHHIVTKRSIEFNESEAIQLCTEALTTITNEACSDIGVDSSSSEIENCVADLMISGDRNWTRFAVDRSESHCLETLEKNTTLQEESPEISNIIRNNTCPNNCSEQGSCSNGKCECEEGFASEDCSFDLNAPLEIYGLDNDGVCDVDGGCSFVVVEGLDFPSDRNYTCRFSGRETFLDEIQQTLEATNVSAQHQSLFEIICNLPEISIPINRLGIEYNVSVAMDGFDFGDDINFVVINAACQYFTNNSGVIKFNIQEGFCFIDGACHSRGSYKEDALCLKCKPEESVYTWSNSSADDCVVSDRDTPDPDTTLEFIVPLIMAIFGFLIICVFIGILCCYCKAKHKSHKMIHDITIDDTCDEEKEIFSIAWPSKDRSEIQTDIKQTKLNWWMDVLQGRSVKSASDNVLCTSHKPITGTENLNNDTAENTTMIQKDFITKTHTWTIDQNEESNTKQTTDNTEADVPINTSRFIIFEERCVKDMFESEEKNNETAGNIIFVTETTPQASRNEPTRNDETSHYTIIEPTQKKTKRRRKHKRKKNLTSHEPLNTDIDESNEQTVSARAVIPIIETNQRHAQSFRSEDERYANPEEETVVFSPTSTTENCHNKLTVIADTSLSTHEDTMDTNTARQKRRKRKKKLQLPEPLNVVENEERDEQGIDEIAQSTRDQDKTYHQKETVVNVEPNNGCQEPMNAMVVRDIKSPITQEEDNQEYEEIIIIGKSDTDTSDIEGGGDHMTNNIDSAITESKPNTSEVNGKRKRRKKKRRRKKISPELPGGATATVNKEGEGAKVKKKKPKKKNKSKGKSK